MYYAATRESEGRPRDLEVFAWSNVQGEVMLREASLESTAFKADKLIKARWATLVQECVV